MNNNDVINSDWMKTMGSKKEFLTKLFTVFLRDEPARVLKIKDALESGQMEELKYLAHSLKGAAATMGADRVKDACLKLEHSALSGNSSKAEQDLQSLESEMKLVYEFMSNHIN